MSYNIDFTTATSDQIEAALGKRLESIRLSRNIAQQQLAEEAGVSTRTIRRLEKGQGVSLDGENGLSRQPSMLHTRGTLRANGRAGIK